MVFAIALFMISLTLLIFLWDSVISRIHDAELMYDMSWLSNTLSEQLVRTAGYPGDWDSSTVQVYGLAEKKDVIGFEGVIGRIIDPEKFLYFVNRTHHDYVSVRGILLGTSKYNFYVKVECRDGTVECFEGLHVPSFNGTVVCDNGLRINATNGTTNVDGGGYCIIGRYISPLASIHLTSTSTNALFTEKFNVSNIAASDEKVLTKAAEYQVVVYVGDEKGHLYVSPPYTKKDSGINFAVDINVTDAVDLYAAEFNITYDPARLTVVALFVPAAFLQCGGVGPVDNVNQGPGWMEYTLSRLGASNGCSGSGTIAKATFRGESTTDYTPLELIDVKLSDSRLNDITGSVSSGQVTVPM